METMRAELAAAESRQDVASECAKAEADFLALQARVTIARAAMEGANGGADAK